MGVPVSRARSSRIFTKSLLASRPGLFREYSTSFSWWLLLSETPR